MKYMNMSRYAQNPFRHARFKAAPDGGDGGSLAEDGDGDGGGGSAEDKSAAGESVDDLKLQLAKAQAEASRYKSSIDKLTAKNGELTKQNRQFMSDEEKAKAEQEERDKELAELKQQVRVSEYSKRFVGLGMTESDADALAKTLPSMEDAESFFDGIGKYVESVRKTSAETAVQELLKNRPDINAGNGEAKTSLADEKAVELAKSRTVTQSNDIADYYKVGGRK